MDATQYLIQGGAVSIALVALYIIYRMQNGQRIEFMQELKANRESNAEQSILNRASMEKMAAGANATATALSHLTEKIERLPKRSSDIRRPRRRN